MAMISTGEILRSKSGRLLSAAPKIDCSTDRKCKMSLQRMQAWLKSEALLEVVGNEYLELIVSNIRPLSKSKLFTKSDVEFLNDILFDAAGDLL